MGEQQPAKFAALLLAAVDRSRPVTWEPVFERWTTPAERERSARFAGAAARSEYLLARVLVRWAVVNAADSGVANAAADRAVVNAADRAAANAAEPEPGDRPESGIGFDPAAIEIDRDETGRPRLPGAPSLALSISHCDGLVAVGLCAGAGIGVDVEAERRFGLDGEPESGDASKGSPMRIARRLFAPAEVAALGASGELDRRLAMVRYWTLKEAVGKAVGVGIERSLSGAEIDLSGNTARLRRVDFGPPPEQWCLHEVPLDLVPGVEVTGQWLRSIHCALALTAQEIKLSRPRWVEPSAISECSE